MKIKALLPALLALLNLPLAAHAEDKLTVVTYNILYGLRGDAAIQEEYVDWMAEVDPDIVALQEVNGFTQRKLEAMAAEYGHPYAVLSKLEGFPVALTSKYPIVKVEKVVDNMWHAYIYANINGMHVFVVHLSSHLYEKRRNEVREILARAALIPEGEPIIVMGDFNSLSREDAAQYDEAYINYIKEFQAANPRWRNLDEDGKVDFSVVESMKEAGFTDALRVFEPEFQVTYPTSSFDKGPGVHIDYIWVNEPLAEKLISTKVVYDENTHKISDHYPIVAEFEE